MTQDDQCLPGAWALVEAIAMVEVSLMEELEGCQMEELESRLMEDQEGQEAMDHQEGAGEGGGALALSLWTTYFKNGYGTDTMLI